MCKPWSVVSQFMLHFAILFNQGCVYDRVVKKKWIKKDTKK